MYAEAAFASPKDAKTIDILVNTATPVIAEVPVP